MYLFDVGFQLSFMAVLGIFLFYPLIDSLFVVRNKIVAYLWNIISLSLSAQLATLPLILYYFGTFPVYFLLSNLVVAPIAVFMTICSYLFFCSFNDAKTKKKFIVIAVIAGFCSLGKVIFTLDRLPILSVFIVLFFYSIRIRKSNFKIIALVVVFFIVSFFLLKFVTSTKMNNMSILDFLSLYSGLGIVNFQLLLNNFSEWSYGLNSFFHPFYFIGKAFNYNIHIPAAQDSFWGNARGNVEVWENNQF
jgi:predicted membrane metal-binding protein